MLPFNLANFKVLEAENKALIEQSHNLTTHLTILNAMMTQELLERDNGTSKTYTAGKGRTDKGSGRKGKPTQVQ
jgi:hypothetical protein